MGFWVVLVWCVSRDEAEYFLAVFCMCALTCGRGLGLTVFCWHLSRSGLLYLHVIPAAADKSASQGPFFIPMRQDDEALSGGGEATSPRQSTKLLQMNPESPIPLN